MTESAQPAKRLQISDLESRIAELSATVSRFKVESLSAFSAGDCTNGCTDGCTGTCTNGCTGACVADPTVLGEQVRT